jgi:hypothetical protein
MDVAASTSRMPNGPMTGIRTPASRGPTSWPARAIPRSVAFARSRDIIARLASPGISAMRPVSACEVKLVRRKTRMMSCQNCSTPRNCRRGIVATAAPLRTSPATLVLSAPSRSTRGPPRTAGATAPMAIAAPVRPTAAGDPVV